MKLISTLYKKYLKLRTIHRFSSILKVSVLAFSIISILLLLLSQYNELVEFDDFHSYFRICFRGFLLYPLSLFLQAWIWGRIMAQLSKTRGGWWDFEIYAYTHLMRHLPGAVWYLAGRTALYRERSISTSITLVASGLEWLLLLAAAVIVYWVIGNFLSLTWLWGFLFLFLSALIISLVVHHYPCIELNLTWMPKPVSHWFSDFSTVNKPSWMDFLLWISVYTIAYLIGGEILYWMIKGVVPSASVTWFEAVRIWSLVGGVSFLFSMIIPSGLGARELTLTALLSPIISTAGALLVAVLLRLLFAAGDFFWGGALWSMARLFQKKHSVFNS